MPEALADFQNAYNIFRNLGESRLKAVSLQTIAKIYIDCGDAKRAIKYYKQANEEYDGDTYLSLAVRNNIGNAFLDIGDFKKAEIEFRKALKLVDEIGIGSHRATVLTNIASAQIEQGNLAGANQTLGRTEASARIANDAGQDAKIHEMRARIAFFGKRNNEAARQIGIALQRVGSSPDSDSFRQVHKTAYQVYSAVNRKALALAELETVWRLDGAAAKLTASNNAALMAARFDFASQNARIARLKAKELELQRNLLIAVVAGGTLVLLVLSVGLILITRSRDRERAAKLVLAETNVQLEKAIAAKMEFLATTSHEIRTPLNGILGMTQVMLADRDLSETLRDRIGIVHGAGEAMRLLVDDILDVAKMETGKLSVGTGSVDLKATLRQVAQVWRLQAEAAGIALVVDTDRCPDWIEGDAGRIRQIIFNLLSNAMKFTANGSVELRATTNGEGGDRRILISVHDSGIGIAPEWHESIFELFQQVDGGTTRQYGGTGLGLAICRNLARAMGGDITVQSEPGFGSTFTMDLPFVEPVVTARVTTGDEAASVVVIERNPLTRGLMRAMLSHRFGDIIFVGDVTEACALLAVNTVEWIIADAASIDDFNRLFEATEVPILLLEGSEPLADDTRVRATDVLCKPLTKSALLQALLPYDRLEAAA